MDNDNHPITPPPKLLQQWEDDILNERDNIDHVLDCAWRHGFCTGADQELEACVEWMGDSPVIWRGDPEEHPGFYLREARRPKPPSFKEGAIEALDELDSLFELPAGHYSTILRALEQLNG